ncbi:MAG TPA: hemerythrin domain-containing protein [Lacipirellula sp.]
MVGILQALCEDHANMSKLLDAFERQLAVFERAEVPDHDILSGVIEYCLAYPDLYHHPKEDLLIAKLSERDPGRLTTIRNLRQEHLELGALTRRLAAADRHVRLGAELPRESFSALAREFVDLYRRHMDSEERLLFAGAVETLTPDDWAAIERDAVAAAGPLFGPTYDRRFEILRNSVLAWDGCR